MTSPGEEVSLMVWWEGPPDSNNYFIGIQNSNSICIQISKHQFSLLREVTEDIESRSRTASKRQICINSYNFRKCVPRLRIRQNTREQEKYKNPRKQGHWI
ncbi:hypothetical protein CEXT_810351 [Caerostris extrusa]|uniref:Uncharacterized protein n=1 Tax=Caerostris extrusa TaxID=172846 RepID=A0AAV4UDF1_CAEEX|nr:hypothetical protein CEXT_810351 [Caerostris extrusa]